MTTKYVEWCSSTYLPCGNATNRDVILCLQSASLTAPISCPEDSTDDYSYSFIEATVCQAYQANPICGGSGRWNYKFQYDSDVLAEGVSSLASSDIIGAFCKDCETSWIEELIGNEVSIFTDLNNNTFLKSQHGCMYQIGGTEGNTYSFLNTNTVDISDCGSPSHTIEAFVNISSVAGNALQELSDGLYVDLTNLVSPSITGTFTMKSSTGFLGNTVDGSDTYRFYICPGGNIEDPTRGAYITVYGNESGVGIPGGINFAMGNIAGAHFDFGVGGAASSYLRFYGGGTLQLQVQASRALAFKNSGNELSGVGAALLGANCPAVTVAAPYTWIKVETSDGSVGYIPVWK